MFLKLKYFKNLKNWKIRKFETSERQTKAGNQEFQSLNVIENLENFDN